MSGNTDSVYKKDMAKENSSIWDELKRAKLRLELSPNQLRYHEKNTHWLQFCCYLDSTITSRIQCAAMYTPFTWKSESSSDKIGTCMLRYVDNSSKKNATKFQNNQSLTNSMQRSIAKFWHMLLNSQVPYLRLSNPNDMFFFCSIYHPVPPDTP